MPKKKEEKKIDLKLPKKEPSLFEKYMWLQNQRREGNLMGGAGFNTPKGGAGFYGITPISNEVRNKYWKGNAGIEGTFPINDQLRLKLGLENEIANTFNPFFKAGLRYNFQHGGEINRYDNGGEVKPYVAKDQADFDYRTQMYNDSLELYNSYIDAAKFMNNHPHFSKSKTNPYNENMMSMPLSTPEFEGEGRNKGNTYAYDNLIRYEIQGKPREERGQILRDADQYSEYIPRYGSIDYSILPTGKDVFTTGEVTKDYINNRTQERLREVMQSAEGDTISDTGWMPGIETFDTEEITSERIMAIDKYQNPTQKVYPPSEGFPNTTNGEFTREITNIPQDARNTGSLEGAIGLLRLGRHDINPVPGIVKDLKDKYQNSNAIWAPPSPDKSSLSKIEEKDVDLNFDKINLQYAVEDGTAQDEYVRPNNVAAYERYTGGNNFASMNLPGQAPRGISYEEYKNYFFKKGKYAEDTRVTDSFKYGGWLGNYHNGGEIGHTHEDSQYNLPTYSSTVGSEAPVNPINIPQEEGTNTQKAEYLRREQEAFVAQQLAQQAEVKRRKEYLEAHGGTQPSGTVSDNSFNTTLPIAPDLKTPDQQVYDFHEDYYAKNDPTGELGLRERDEDAIRQAQWNKNAWGGVNASYGLEDPIFMAALTGAQALQAVPVMGATWGARTVLPFARGLAEELSMGLTEAPNLAYQLGKAGYKGAKNIYKSINPTIPQADYAKNILNKTEFPEGMRNPEFDAEFTEIIDSKLRWLDSDEYLKRRMANTGETAAVVKKNVEKLKKNIGEAKLNFKKGEGPFGRAIVPTGINKLWSKSSVDIYPEVINRNSKNTGIKSILGVLEHEYDHIGSPMTGFQGYDLADVYPLLKTHTPPIPERNKLQKLWETDKTPYLEIPIEQQVRFNRLNKLIRNDLGIKDKKLTTSQIDEWFNSDSVKKLQSIEYNDIGELLASSSKNLRGNAKSIFDTAGPYEKYLSSLKEAMNKAWGVAGVGTAGALGVTQAQTPEYRYGGTLNRYGNGGEIGDLPLTPPSPAPIDNTYTNITTPNYTSEEMAQMISAQQDLEDKALLEEIEMQKDTLSSMWENVGGQKDDTLGIDLILEKELKELENNTDINWADDYYDWETDYYANTFKLEDPRVIRATTGDTINPNVDLMGGNYNSEVVQDIIQKANQIGVDPWTALAVGLQETLLGKNDINLGHVKSSTAADSGLEFFDPYGYINVLKDKLAWANKDSVDNEALALQYYNGTGSLFPNTEEDYHGFQMQKAYGVPIPKEGLDMQKNPLYGKQIIDLRENVLKQNEYIRQLIEEAQ